MQRAGDRKGAGSSLAAEIKSRGDALRQAVALPDAELRPVLDAVLIELDAAVTSLAEFESRQRADAHGQDAIRAERHLLRATFQQVPVALFLLAPDGTIRRANSAAAELLGANSGYATGKRFTALIDPPARAASSSQLAAVARTGEPRRFSCGLLGAGGILTCELTVRTVSVSGEDDRLLLAASPAGSGPAGTDPAGADPAGAGRAGAGRAGAGRAGAGRAGAGRAGASRAGASRAAGSRAEASQAGPGTATQAVPPAGSADTRDDAVLTTMTRRLDLVMAANRLLLENVASSEAVLLQRIARLLADQLATWVLIDVKHGDRLLRHSVAGPDEEDSGAQAQAAMAVSPPPDSVPAHVAWTGSSVLLAHIEDDTVLGTTKDGVPLLLLLRGASVLCLPVTASGICYGTLTLVRPGAHGPFRLADAGLAQEVAEQLARAIAAHRMIERRTEAAESLQASMLPRELKPIPGVRLGAAHLPPTLGSDVGGDFYDIYATPQGWGAAIGDVCGKGRDAAAVTAAARHAIRVLGHWNPDPGEVLRAANEIMLAEGFDGRFVTADAAHLSWHEGKLRVVLGSAGHPGPVLITADGRAQLIEGGGVPLGVFADGEVAVVERELMLDVGDVLFFCTDGLTGARSPDLTYFGERLVDELAELAGRSPAELIAGLEARLIKFCDGVLLDDVTMLALQPVEPPSVT